MGGYFTHIVGCPKEADPRNEICDCERLFKEHLQLALEIDRETYKRIKESK